MKTSILNKVLFALVLLFAISCSKDINTMSDGKSPSQGKGGSTARITIVGDYLYAVDNNSLKVIDISNPSNPVQVNVVTIATGIETIYSFKNYLFIGANAGMYIYSLSTPTNPTQLSDFEHVTSCDPVIANDSMAYVTLRNTEICNRFIDTREIQVLNIMNITNPSVVNIYNTDNAPYGLDMNYDYLFVCHGTAGFSIYNKNKVATSQTGALIKTVSGINAYDAILYNNILYIIGESGFYQYDYSNINNPILISSIVAGS